MQQNYSKKIEPIQKATKNTASSVLDASSQSEGLQRKADMVNNAAQREEAPRPNNTGMPDNLKSGIESLSGFSMDDVRVHYNSSKPATVQALAYTQGTDIHVAPGQEKHLPHEAWHVAQQMAGRVSPTTNINGMPVNDNAGLEHEADVMGEKAVAQRFYDSTANKSISDNNPQMINKTMQLLGKWQIDETNERYQWTTIRSGVQWYCDFQGLMWYEITDEGKVPKHLLNGYRHYQRIKKNRMEWNRLWELWASSKIKSGAPGLGMEIELDRDPKRPFKTEASVERPVKEKDFKTTEVYRIVNNIVKVTFDTQTGYLETKNQTLTIELVFDHTKIPLESDLDAIFENLGCEIMELTYAKINEMKKRKTAFDRIKMDEEAAASKVVDNENIRFNIHVTVACPLEKIYTTNVSMADTFYERYKGLKTVGESNKDQIQDQFRELTKLEQDAVKQKLSEGHPLIRVLNEVTTHGRKDVRNFFRLLNSITVRKGSNDPKQSMEVMNRTCFGKIFFLMDRESQTEVITHFNDKVKDFSYTGTDSRSKESHTVSRETLYNYLLEIYNTNAEDQQKDPSYLAAQEEKFGISELGDTTAIVNKQECPIFEFRQEFSQKSIKEFNQLAEILKKRFWGSVNGFESVTETPPPKK